MGTKFFNRIKGSHVLVAPLDWGLGHATRCIPLIHALLQADKKVTIGASGPLATILGIEFPALNQIPLPGYNIKYHDRSLAAGILAQWPRIRKVIRQEHVWLDRVISEHKIDTVLSDNRYGLYNKKVHTIFLTHQLQIQSPLRLTNGILRRWHYRKIQRFNECWVPDHAERPGLAGDLSHPPKLPSIAVEYIGPLSRFQNTVVIGQPVSNNHILVILSGPEPHRGFLEDKLIDQLVKYHGTATVVRALPNNETYVPDTNHLKFYNHLPAAQLLNEINKAALVIARCGYSTVMDMFVLKKNCLLIPTPGQTEQEYLASHLTKHGIMKCVNEKDLDINDIAQTLQKTS